MTDLTQPFCTYRIGPLGIERQITVPDFRRYPMGYPKRYRLHRAPDVSNATYAESEQYRQMQEIQERINRGNIPTTD